jgi:hypothetical protein
MISPPCSNDRCERSLAECTRQSWLASGSRDAFGLGDLHEQPQQVDVHHPPI